MMVMVVVVGANNVGWWRVLEEDGKMEHEVPDWRAKGKSVWPLYPFGRSYPVGYNYLGT